VPQSIKDDKIEWAWNKPKKTLVHLASYFGYNKLFGEQLVENTEIKETFAAFESTAWFERLTLNVAQFSCAKDIAESKALQTLALEAKSFTDFKEQAEKIVNLNRDTWLRVEMDSVKRGAVMGEAFRSMQKDADLYPYWQYSGEVDDRERSEHLALEGLVFKIGDPEGDACYPPNDFNCRCRGVPIDKQELNESGKEVTKGEDILDEDDKQTGEPYIDEKFRYCPADQTLPNTGGYFEVFSNINKLNYEDFE